MKKKYQKPQLYIDELSINECIATGCKVMEGANHHRSSCSIPGEIIDDEFGEKVEVNLFMTNACDTKPDCLDTYADQIGYFFS